MKSKEAIGEIKKIIDGINSFHEFHYDPDADENLAREGIGVYLEFHPRIYLRFNSQDASLDPNGDLEFLLVGWYTESDGFTVSPNLKANNHKTEAYLENLPRLEGMPFWGYQENKPFCTGDRNLLDRPTIDLLKTIYSLRRELGEYRRLYLEQEI